jgi:hypothetical protein
MVEKDEGILNSAVDPRAVAIFGFLRTGADNIGKDGVGRDAKPVFADGFGQRMRNVEIVERQDRPAFWLDPIGIGIIARVGHRENPAGIGAQQKINVYLQGVCIRAAWDKLQPLFCACNRMPLARLAVEWFRIVPLCG